MRLSNSNRWTLFLGMLACGMVLLFAAAHAAEVPVTFSSEINNELKVADARVVELQGVKYVPINLVVNQLGGASTASPGGVQLDLAAKSAALKAGQTLVTGSIGAFELSTPIVGRGKDLLIALADVAPFFDKAFRLSLKQDAATPPVPVPKTPLSASAPQTSPPASTVAATPPPEPAEVLTPLDAPEAVKPAGPSGSAPAPNGAEELTPLVETPASPQVPAPEGRPVARRIETLIIDPGHGGVDTGCVGAAGLTESALALSIAQQLEKALAQESALKVVLTRQQDATVSGRTRVSLANDAKGDLFISLHAGTALTPDAHGFKVFCHRPEQAAEGSANSARAAIPHAGDEYAAISVDMAGKLAAVLGPATGAGNNGVHTLPCRIIEDVGMPGVLLEVGCLSNANEEALLKTEAYQDKIVQAIATWIKGLRAAQGGTTS